MPNLELLEFFPRQDNYVHPKPMYITATNFKEDLNPDKNHLNKFDSFIEPEHQV